MNILNYLLQNQGTQWLDYLLIISIVIAIFAFMFGNRGVRRANYFAKPPEIHTELICTECGFKEIRKFSEGDYVGKETGEKCKKCGGTTRINLIYTLTSPIEEKS